MVLLSAAFALLGLYLLTKRPVVWRAPYAFPIVFPLIMGLLWLDKIREDFDFLMVVALTIGGAIPWAREHFGPTESWSIHNASRAVIAAREHALRNHAIPFDWRRKRLRLPTVGIGGSSLAVSRWFGSIGIVVSAADADERRVVAKTVLPLLREELSELPRRFIPGSGVFFLAWGALALVAATQLPKLFR